MSKASWNDHFKTQLAPLADQFSAGPNNPSLLMFALREHAIPMDEYIAWAKENYQIPSIKIEFFSANPANPDFWQRWKDKGPWNMELIPLQEWDGVLLIACLYPPTQPLPFRHCLLLAPYTALEHYWSQYHASAEPVEHTPAQPIIEISTETSTEEPPIELKDENELVIDISDTLEAQPANTPQASDAPEIPNAPEVSASASAPEGVDLIDLDNLASTENAPPSTEESPSEADPSSDPLDGLLDLNPPTPGTSSSIVVPPPVAPKLERLSETLIVTQNEDPAAASPKLSTPADAATKAQTSAPHTKSELESEFVLADIVTSVPAMKATPKSSTPTSAASLTKAPPPTKTTTPTPSVEKKPNASEEKVLTIDLENLTLVTNPAASLPPRNENLKKIVSNPTSETTTSPQEPEKPKPVATSTPPKTSASQVPSETVKAKPKSSTPITEAGDLFFLKDLCQNNIEAHKAFLKILSEMKNHYSKFMFLAVNTGEDKATPLLWSTEFSSNENPDYIISLKVPCIFYIAAATQKPFHGPISSNEVNEKFFEDWNQGEIPDHVTIIPIIFKDTLIGMTLGVSDKSAYPLSVLRFAEKIGANILAKISELEKQSKAA